MDHMTIHDLTVHYPDLVEYLPLLDNVTAPKYFTYGAGMGCILYFRRYDVDHEVELFIMHPDNYGQYEIDDKPQLTKFIQGCELIKIS